MKILFFCTAHNSLSQRLFLVLSRNHSISIEYALCAEKMIEAADLAKPHLIICPFLTSAVPQQVYETYLTLIVHPGPPGDAGPSALDWMLMGDDGTEADSQRLLRDNRFNPVGRSHWAVTVLQAIAEFDKGPVWAFDQFPVNINDTRVSKSSLYRGPVTHAAVAAILAAIQRIEAAASLASKPCGAPLSPPLTPRLDSIGSAVTANISPGLSADRAFAELSVTTSEPFLGGNTHYRPLLKASERHFDIRKHTASAISRRIRSADSQPGCLSNLFGPKLYLYGGIIENPTLLSSKQGHIVPGSIIAVRNEAVCVATCDNKGIWITHVRQVKAKTDVTLWPKVPAAPGLEKLGISTGSPSSWFHPLLLQTQSEEWAKSYHDTFREIWVDFVTDGQQRFAYLYFDFYNGAMSTEQCRRMVRCLEYISSTANGRDKGLPLAAVVLMGGGSYFSNGIHLNVIDSAADPALESWYNINAIDDVVEKLLLDLPACGITTIAAIRGNCAAGGVALAAACDVVLAGQHVVLNPAYRSLGLSGSEFHSVSYRGRCGTKGAEMALRTMTPLSADDARGIGIVDYVLDVAPESLNAAVQAHVENLFARGDKLGPTPWAKTGAWKRNVDTSPAGLALARTAELGQMSMDFWSARSERYHSRRRSFVRKVKPSSTPLRFATHRREEGMMDDEEQDTFDSVEWFAEKSMQSLKRNLSDRAVRSIKDFFRGCDNYERRNVDSSMGRDDEKFGAGATVFGCYYNN
ncbi:C-type cyclin [Metarhizium album ARSEF 1941]|uniref:C-type cyclin n=1 Tax=Metarhizium album (strain ARSEF 1941) TaxID=1081103 RepID=A0A0B2WXW6_METAS|nr:C-type cyclin [Metarhizium album ARSEF 1941]KHN98434.1 C-type cyclin [Metarhizium album ARSEF 1941]